MTHLSPRGQAETAANEFVLPSGFLYASALALQSLKDAGALLFDLDVTIYAYDPDFEHSVKRAAFVSLSGDLSAAVTEQTLHDLDTAETRPQSPKSVIREHLGQIGVANYYEACRVLFDSMLTPGAVVFNPGALKLLEYAREQHIDVGVISNNTKLNGQRILRCLADQTGIDLLSQSLFLADSGIEKPDPHAFEAYLSTVNANLGQPRVYIGDIVEDVEFANNIHATGVLHGVQKVPEVAGDHIVVTDLTHLYNYLADNS